MPNPNENPAALDDSHKQIEEKLTEKRKQLQTEIEEAFANASRMSTTGEVGYVEANQNLPEKQIHKLDLIFDRHKDEINQATGGKLDDLALSIIKEAETHVNTVKAMVNLVASKDGNSILNENEIHELGLILNQSDDLAKEHPEIMKILEKLSERRKLEHENDSQAKLPPETQLTEEDYEDIVALMNPRNMRKARIDKSSDLSSADAFTETNLGTVLALMNPAERVKLIEVMMDSDKAKDVPDTIDFLTRNAVLTLPQARYLFKRAQDEGIITAFQAKEYDQKIDHEYADDQKKIQEALEKATVQLKGQFATNELNRFFGMEGVGYVMKIHSIIWLAAGFLVNHADLKEFFFSPYTIAAAGEFLASEGITEFGGRVGAKWGGIADLIEKYFGDDGGPVNAEEAKAFNDLGDLYSKHMAFTDYLKMGGAGHILALKQD